MIDVRPALPAALVVTLSRRCRLQLGSVGDGELNRSAGPLVVGERSRTSASSDDLCDHLPVPSQKVSRLSQALATNPAASTLLTRRAARAQAAAAAAAAWAAAISLQRGELANTARMFGRRGEQPSSPTRDVSVTEHEPP